MANYKIFTDSACDLPKSMLDQMGVGMVPLYLNFRGECREDSVEDGIKTVYDAMRAGESASTAAVNPDRWAAAMEPVLAAGEDVLVIGFSSGLSTTYQSAVIAAEELREKYPQRKIITVDSLCASLGQGLLVWYACKKRDEGLELEELAKWVQDTIPNLSHWFTVGELTYLKRGGRVSAATALIGTMLNIKPILHVDDEGHLISMAKVRGRKASVEALASKLGQTGISGANDTIFICHGDCIEDAEYLKKLAMEKYGVKEVFIGYTGAVIGAHSGPGTLAIFFLGEHR